MEGTAYLLYESVKLVWSYYSQMVSVPEKDGCQGIIFYVHTAIAHREPIE
jgi:hypothetical protein